jgi:chromosome segregation ATPase
LILAQSLEITTPWVMVTLSILGIGASFALYVMRMEMKSFVQSAIQDAIAEIMVNLSDRTKEINRRIDTVERDGNSLRTEVGAMSTSQSFMSANLNKLELSMEKLESKIDTVSTQSQENNSILKVILSKLEGNHHGNR